MKYRPPFILILGFAAGIFHLAQRSAPGAPAPRDFLVLPSAESPLQFRIYTNVSAESSHVFNSIEIEAYGQRLLQSAPDGDEWRQGRGRLDVNELLANVLVNGKGPNLNLTNGVTVREETSGPEWRSVSLDLVSAYRGRLTRFERTVVFVEPDLFVLCDRAVSPQRITYEMLLHVPNATLVDTNWGDLHLDTPETRMVIHSPGRRHELRPWKRVNSAADSMLPGTVTMALVPTNTLNDVQVVTVFAISGGGQRRDYSFKLLESPGAVGAQIQRDGLPTLLGFNTRADDRNSSLHGFGFSGPVGVYVYHPKKRP